MSREASPFVARPKRVFFNLTRKQVFISLVLILLVPGLLLNAAPTRAHGTGTTATTTTTGISFVTTSLPSGTVQTAYQAVIQVKGGSSSYQFTVDRGSLPPGLSLDSTTGAITGTPTTAGSYKFNVLVTDLPSSDRGDHSFTISISGSSTSTVKVAISPTSGSLVSGGTLQFAATVSGTSQTGVTWKASAGTVSSSGLFTAPTVSAKTNVTVTATSVADTTKSASALVSVSPTPVSQPLTITSVSVPPAYTGSSYQANLYATGGQTPYQWQLASGSLPAGFSLSSSGTISGTTGSTGSFSFTVQVKDGAQNTASAAFTLLVSSVSSNCGPPSYNCSRADLTIAPVPTVPPQVGSHACVSGQLNSCGNLYGANTVVTDPDFRNRIVRATDKSTSSGSVQTSITGSADPNMWNQDSTMFVAQDTGAAAMLFGFDPSTMQAHMIAHMPLMGGGSGWSWSFVNPNVLYRLNGTTVYSYDLSGMTTTVPSPKLVYDFASSQCLGSDPLWAANPNVTWRSIFAISKDDQTFSSGFSNAGGQGTGYLTAVYTVGKGCRVLDSKSGIVYGNWGPTGQINIPDRWTMHANALGKGGDVDLVGFTTCLSGGCGHPPYFWNVATLTINNPGGCLTGHWTEGYSHWMNNSGCNHIGQDTIRPYAALTTWNFQISSFPSNMLLQFDQHFSWNNADQGDTLPILSSSWTNLSALPAAWYNEILGTYFTGIGNNSPGTIKRFAHSFITGQSHRFNAKYAIGHVSQDGRFFMFASDWLGTLGSESGSTSCTVGTNCRSDVFIVELR